MTERRRIVSVTETLFIGGDEMRLLNFARTLDRARYDHEILVMSPLRDHSAQYGPIAPLFEEAGVRVQVLGESPRRFAKNAHRGIDSGLVALVRAPRILRQLLKAILEKQPSILDLRKHYAIFFGAIAGRLANVPVITGIDYYSELLEPPQRRIAAKLAFRLLDAFMSDCRFTTAGYERNFAALRGKTVVIPNGVKIPRASETRTSIRKFFGLEGPDGPTVGQIAKLVPFKGQCILLEAAKLVCTARSDVSFIVCGYARRNEFRSELLERIETLGLRGRVGVAGYPGPSDDIWAAIDIYAHASLMDSSPIAIHESMALGLPAVVTSVGGIPELVTHDLSGLIVPPGDAGKLAEAILQLLSNPDLAARLGSAAKHRYMTTHTPEAMVEQTCGLFDYLLLKKLGASHSFRVS
jgi:glycosyltransferase involved in cell wall biosynthesis